MAGIATDDDEGGEDQRETRRYQRVTRRYQRETRRYQRVTRSWEGKMVLGRRRSHQVQRIGTLNCSNS